MIWTTQFPNMGGPVTDPWISAYPQHWPIGDTSDVESVCHELWQNWYSMFMVFCRNHCEVILHGKLISGIFPDALLG